MKLKRLIVIACLIVLTMAFVFSFIKNNEISEMNNELKNKITSLEHYKSEVELINSELREKETIITDLEQAISEKEKIIENIEQEIIEKDQVLMNLEAKNIPILPENKPVPPIYSSYSILNDYAEVPAWGPTFVINEYALEHSLESGLTTIKVMDSVGEDLTRISIDGLIPTWYLQEHGNTYREFANPIQHRYVINEKDLLLTPKVDSKINQSLHKGNVVRLIGEYGEWYHVEKVLLVDANLLHTGWIKKEDVGYFEDLESKKYVEVRLKNAGEFRWWWIDSETEDTYTLVTTGIKVIEINKDEVEPFFYRE
ncbi:hypothetical protein EZV73_01805 [Acidaminobacter sp. JC074]|uniref:hypothetical protein n=1 Tax=Acidaminobacter sp. JC074 TaxID=2530199 RepID=UPI001F1042ED|nr:hypothetical protein [Acidaminobacter sp. JC074]MCH4886280.1 hypothetical protein [Acidaminobacter sp. JC074]